MNTEPPLRWAQIQALFDACVEQPLPARARLIAQAGLNPAEMAELHSLLAHHEALPADTHPFLAEGAAELLGTPPPQAPPAQAAQPGQRLGPWELVAPLGSGGMGEVYEARRADGQFEGGAAVKLLKRGLDSAAVLQRFALERQALARLNHPHIARLLDAGQDAQGRPYFVMELVRGQPIDRAVHGLALEQRLQLFLQLADAVSHAHRHLLVHRDLKPGNVLVTQEGQVKLLDFGIAKALDPLEGLDPGQTAHGDRPFTPHYASPEQVRGEPVSTATDLYSLGVLLYVLLTGQRPYGRQAGTAQEAVRSVLEEQPTRPSALSPAAGEPDAHWLATRRRLRGDLDNILLKALNKAPEERYSSVEALAQDLRAHLAGQPVSAHPPSALYLVAKFLRRHRLGTSLGAAALAAVLGFAGLAWQQKQRAESRFADLRALARAVLFDYHDLVEPLAGATPVRQRLVKDALTYLDKLAQAAPSDRGLRREMGVAYRTIGYVQRNGFRRPHLGDTAGALRSYARGIALLEQLHAEDPQDEDSGYELALVLSARAGVHAEERELPQAQALLQRAAALFTGYLPQDRPDHRHRLELARTHLRLGDALYTNGQAAAAAAQIDQARRVLESLASLSPGHAELPHVWVWVHNLAISLARRQGDWATVLREESASHATLSALAAAEPDNARYQEDLADSASEQMSAHAELGNAAAVAHWQAQALQGWARLVQRDPQDRNAGAKHIGTQVDAALAQARIGQAAPARALLQQAAQALDDAERRWPGEPALQRPRQRLQAAQQRLGGG